MFNVFKVNKMGYLHSDEEIYEAQEALRQEERESKK